MLISALLINYTFNWIHHDYLDSTIKIIFVYRKMRFIVLLLLPKKKNNLTERKIKYWSMNAQISSVYTQPYFGLYLWQLCFMRSFHAKLAPTTCVFKYNIRSWNESNYMHPKNLCIKHFDLLNIPNPISQSV